MKSIEVLLLSRKDVVNLMLTPTDVVSVVEDAMREHAAGTYEMHPKIGVHPTGTDPANFIHAMPAYLHKLGACGLKWVAGFARNYRQGLPNVTGLQVYNDTATGIPLAIMDCSYLTGLRTAAVSAIAAKRCARSSAETLALVGCGFEGGCAYTPEALHQANKFVVDDVALAEYFEKISRDRKTEDGQPDPEFLGGMPGIYATIGEIVAGKKPGRDSESERIIAIPIGMAICDIAVAHLAYHSALRRGIGQKFQLA